ncbi:MAG: hypothetical protein V3V99_04170 [candidate division Zixibacteria bacterium]
MRKILISVFLTILLTVFISSQIIAVPKMFLPETSFDFGFVPQNCKVSHVFWIKSVGDDSLKILNVKPG